jgi:hypothetical protein
MKRNYQLSRWSRAVARAQIEVIKPQREGWDPPIEEAVLERMERALGRFSMHARLIFVMMLWVLELGGPLVGAPPTRLSRLTRAARGDRLRRFQDSRFPLLRLLFRGVKTFVQLIVYDLPEIDAALGLDHHRWRANRIALRQRVVDSDGDRPRPPTPTALGAGAAVAPERHLDMNAAQAAGSTA